MSSETASPEPRPARAPRCVILAAGEGRRLLMTGAGRPKPLARLLGLSLGERAVATCLAAGVDRFLVVLGYRAAAVRAHFEKVAARRGCAIEFVVAAEWERGNGASALAARDRVGAEPFLLVMADHLVSPSLIERVLRARVEAGEICLAVDRDRAALFDPSDATKVEVRDERVARIGKHLSVWHAADTGVFLCTRALFEGLERAAARGRHGLADGVAELTASRRVRAVDATGEEWLDVDTPAAFRAARRRLLVSLAKGGDDGYIAAHLNRRLSLPLSTVLVQTPVTPNQITVTSFMVSLVGAAFLGLGQYAAEVLGALLVQLASVIDGCDGEIARLKHLATARGAWLDTILDRYADVAVAVAVTLAHAAVAPGVLAWLGGFVAATGFLLSSYVAKEFALRHGHAYPNDVLNRLRRRDLRLFGICCGAIAGRPFAALVALGFLSHACAVGILFRGWRRAGPMPLRPA